MNNFPTAAAPARVTGSTSSLPARAAAVSVAPGPAPRPGLLVVGDERLAALCSSGPLSVSHSVERTATLAAARGRLALLQRAIVVTELDLPDGDGIEVCYEAKTASRTVLVLVCTKDAARVPKALLAGCDSVLLKPFAPNLLYARLGRLTRDLHIRATFPAATLTGGTNQHCPSAACPSCGQSGATVFDATSLRRAWYACLTCEHVWIARRPR
jgi:DNA-binding response OmpR family regulator